MKTTIFRSSCAMMVFAGALVAPAQLPASPQDSTRTHVVRRGDTLWNLAATYLGDAARWREFLEVNPSIRAAVSLPVGATIRIPGTSQAKPRDTTVARPAAPPPSAQTRDTSRTIFFGVRPAGGFAPRESLQVAPVAPAVPASVFEAVSAPFVIDAGALDQSGRCVSIGSAAAPEAGGVLLQGTLSIQLPAAAEADSRWLLVRRGPVLTSLGTVAFPTAIVRLTSASAARQPVTAEVVAQFDAMSCSDAVLPAIGTAAPPSGRRTPVGDGARGRVAWVASESLLPTLQHALILDIGATAGVRPGDRVTIYGGRGGAIVASADVVRVDERSSTALVVRQSLGSLAAGLMVRVTEKLP